ncbi:MAG: hypothetical protein LKI24_09675 [Acidipropionibacterium sp.]|nr:hypothetical protein [Acidipropionibacterium sp.]
MTSVTGVTVVTIIGMVVGLGIACAVLVSLVVTARNTSVMRRELLEVKQSLAALETKGPQAPTTV